jgi:hypothetical protein
MPPVTYSKNEAKFLKKVKNLIKYPDFAVKQWFLL